MPADCLYALSIISDCSPQYTAIASRIARRVIFQRVYEALGLDNAAVCPGGGFYASAAPLSKQTFEYFQSLGMEIQGNAPHSVMGMAEG